MATKVMDQFTGKEKTLYTDQEKYNYHLGRAQDKNLDPTKRAYSSGWLKSNKRQNKKFMKANPNYVPKGKKRQPASAYKMPEFGSANFKYKV